MNDTCLSLLFRPPCQQWLVFSFLSVPVILAAYFMAVLPEWQRFQHCEQRYLQRRMILAGQRQQYAQLATPEQLSALWQSASEAQRENPEGTLEQLLAARHRKVIRWRNNVRPVEIQLELQWTEIPELFRQMTQQTGRASRRERG